MQRAAECAAEYAVQRAAECAAEYAVQRAAEYAAPQKSLFPPLDFKRPYLLYSTSAAHRIAHLVRHRVADSGN